MKTDSVQQVLDKVEAVEMNTFMTRERERERQCDQTKHFKQELLSV